MPIFNRPVFNRPISVALRVRVHVRDPTLTGRAKTKGCRSTPKHFFLPFLVRPCVFPCPLRLNVLPGYKDSVLLLSNLSNNSINQSCLKTNSCYFLSVHKSFMSPLQTVNIQYQLQPEIRIRDKQNLKFRYCNMDIPYTARKRTLQGLMFQCPDKVVKKLVELVR